MWKLERGEFDQLVCAHIALSSTASHGLERARDVLALLPSSVSRRDEEVLGYLSGPVAWPQTQRRRVATGDPTLFVCRPAHRAYDTPTARLIHWLLSECRDLASGSGLPDAGPIGRRIHEHSDTAKRLLLHPKLSALRRPTLPADDKLNALQTRRSTLAPLVDLARLIRDGRYARERKIVEEVMSERLLLPAANDVLFELQVGFRLRDSLVERGFEPEEIVHLLATGRPKLPFARLRSSLHGVVELWWQRSFWSLAGMPPAKGKLREILADARMKQQSFRPDFLLHLRDSNRPVVIEVKLSSVLERANEREGILEALAYLNDAASVVDSLPYPRALVVAWNASGTPARSLVSVADQDRVGDLVDLILHPQGANG